MFIGKWDVERKEDFLYEGSCRIHKVDGISVWFFGVLYNKKTLGYDPVANEAKIIIEIYREKGYTGFARLDGSFTCLLRTPDSAVIFRDHHGTSYQVYYTSQYFSSSLMRLKDMDGFTAVPNYKALSSFLSIGSYPAKIVFGKTYPLLQHSAAALVTSGTATLETALFRVPQVVCYYVVAGQLASFIFKHFFHTKYISLVNLIGGREIVQELFGARFSESQIQDELGRILQDPAYRKRMLDGYDKIIHTLGMPGASKRTARLIVESLGS